MKMTKFIVAAAAALTVGTMAFALDGRTVMQNADDVKKPSFTRAQVKMVLIEKSGAKEERIIDEWGKNEGGLSTVVMQFNTPASVKGTRFSQKENASGPDTKFIFLPDVGTVRPVAASQGSSSFMGSDATYDDMSTRAVDADTHELLAEKEAKNGFANCAKVKSTPKDLKEAQYAYRISWVDKDTWVPVYVEMYSKKTGKICKVLEVKSLKVIKGYPTPLVNEMTNLETGHKTQLLMTEDRLKFDEPINPAYFSKGFLQNGKVSK